MPEPRPLPCPFCGDGEVSLDLSDESLRPFAGRCRCVNCGAMGPCPGLVGAGLSGTLMDNRNACIERWNRRVEATTDVA